MVQENEPTHGRLLNFLFSPGDSIPTLMKHWLKELLFGYDLPQEYICTAKDIEKPFKLMLQNEDMTHNHLFLGYKPLIFGLRSDAPQVRLSVQFENKEYGSFDLKHTQAFAGIGLYTGINAEHQLLPNFYQGILRLKESLKKRPSDNIDLPDNLYEQVKLAYCFSREIDLISIQENGLCNLFPTDLHGQIDSNYYLISLRVGGKANEQIEQIKNLTLCKVGISMYKTAYDLGKNHMRPLQPPGNFPLSSQKSQVYNNHLPNDTTGYIELSLNESIDLGVHRIHMFKILRGENIQSSNPILAHIHSLYANWRHKKGLETIYYWR